MKIHNVIQKTEEWYKLRMGKITASNIFLLRGNSKTRDDLIRTKASEIITGNYIPLKINSVDIERGSRLEDEAIKKYSDKYGINTTEIGFVELDNFVGVSPDCFAEDDGLAEFKCPRDKNYLYIVMFGLEAISKLYLYQMQMQMWVCDKQWCDYVIYNPNFYEDIFKIRLYRDEKIITDIKETIERAKSDIAYCIKEFNKNINGDINHEKSRSNVA